MRQALSFLFLCVACFTARGQTLVADGKVVNIGVFDMSTPPTPPEGSTWVEAEDHNELLERLLEKVLIVTLRAVIKLYR